VAEQEKPLQRRVALKIIKLGMDTRQVVARFEAERQALARMDHPNIAKVFDAGATESGRPYFVMELVKGLKITDYCDRHCLTPLQRLELFRDVCNAIQHAHQKWIFHRDLKPSNILVARHDTAGVPKVIDFGIAKATEGRLTDKTLYTARTQMIGTPVYMSPEQAEFSGLDIDTRSDIYSLGVLFYELLTGRPPFDQRSFTKAALDEIRRIIREVEPSRPSTRLSTLPEGDLETVAKARGEEPFKLLGLLRGDLDWIAMKCLEKDRTRRYQTANALAQDVVRHLAHEPIEARPPSTVYRLKKWVRRNRMSFAAGTTVVAAMLFVAIASFFFGIRERANAHQLQESLARQYLRQGQALCEEGKVSRGLHWMFRSLEEAPVGLAALRRSIEENLSAWSDQWVEPELQLIHDSQLSEAAYSPDGKWVLTSAEDRVLRLWSAVSGELEWESKLPKGHGAQYGRVQFSPDGERIVAAGARIARLWSVSTGDVLGAPMQHESEVQDVAFSPDGQQVLTGSADHTAGIWSGVTGESLMPLLKHDDWVYRVAFSPSGELALTAENIERTGKGKVRFWSARTGEQVGRPLDHGAWIWAVAFSPDGMKVATGGRDGACRLWSVRTGKELCPAIRHHESLWSVVFSPNGSVVLTADLKGTARLWSAENGKPIGGPMYHQGGIMDGWFSSDGELVLTGACDATARFWSVETGEPLGLPLRHECSFIGRTLFNPNGKQVLTAGGKVVKLWSSQPVDSGSVPLEAGHPTVAVFTQSGDQVVTGGVDRTVKAWSPSTGLTNGLAFDAGDPVQDLAFTPSGEYLLVAVQNSVKFLDYGSQEFTGVTLNHQATASAVACSPDGLLIATASSDETAKLWSTVDGGRLLVSLPHSERVTDVEFSPDSKLLITACDDGLVRVWSVEEAREITDAPNHAPTVLAVDVSPDASLIASGGTDYCARFWEVSTGRPKGPVLQHADKVVDVEFSPDGRCLLTACGDWKASLWSVETGERIGPTRSHEGLLHTATFNSAGTHLVTAAYPTSFVWPMPMPSAAGLRSPRLWIEVLTRRTMDADDILSFMDNPTWEAKRRELEQGGYSSPP